MEIAEYSIQKTEDFFNSINLPKTLRELGINDKSNFHIMAEKSLRDGAGNTYFPLSLEDILEILDNAY